MHDTPLAARDCGQTREATQNTLESIRETFPKICVFDFASKNLMFAPILHIAVMGFSARYGECALTCSASGRPVRRATGRERGAGRRGRHLKTL